MKFTTAEALFHKAGGKRTGLPSWCYNNAELTQLEMEQVFLQNWIWVGHVSDIPSHITTSGYTGACSPVS